jgi:glycosyltransferase involved in cell wall biosynthesis
MIHLRYVIPNDPSGYGQANRTDIMALYTAGINVSVEMLKQMTESADYGIAGDVVKRLTNRDIPYTIKITHVTPDLIPQYKEDTIYHIHRLVWETNMLPKDWIAPLNSVDEIWCMTKEQENVVKKSGVTTPTYSFPQAIDVTLAQENIKPYQLFFEKDFIFYSIFQWIARKNPQTLLQAYWKEFTGNTQVTLLIKTYGTTYLPNEFTRIKTEIQQWKQALALPHYPKIFLVQKLLSEADMARFHITGDVYVNPSASEAWGRPVQEAMLLGNPVISPTCGITDIMAPDHYYPVLSTEVPATQQSHIPWYTGRMHWREVTEASLRKMMRKAYEEKKTKKHKTKQYIIDTFSFQKVGQQMKERLEQIQKKIGIPETN